MRRVNTFEITECACPIMVVVVFTSSLRLLFRGDFVVVFILYLTRLTIAVNLSFAVSSDMIVSHRHFQFSDSWNWKSY